MPTLFEIFNRRYVPSISRNKACEVEMTDAPDFICVGVQKAGTTWLDQMLRAHPRIWLPPVKELHYFDDVYIKHFRGWIPRHRRVHALGAIEQQVSEGLKADFKLIKTAAHIALNTPTDDWYKAIFTMAPAGVVKGEMTPAYSLLPKDGIDHILRLNPSVKIILLLRDPVERAWSQIRMITKIQEDIRRRRGRGSSAKSVEEIARIPENYG
jgi:Sulfotransferase family